MSIKHTVKSYLNTQGLPLSLTEDIQIGLAQLHTILTLEDESLSKTLEIQPTQETEIYQFNNGLLKLDELIIHLHPQENQYSLFLKISALLDSTNEQLSNTSLSLYIAQKKQFQEETEQNSQTEAVLSFCAATLCPDTEENHIQTLQSANNTVKQVAQTGWSKIINDYDEWQKLTPEEAPPEGIKSELTLPIYTEEETLLGVLYAQNKEINTFTEDKQALLVALALVLTNLLQNIHWQAQQ